EGTIVVTATGMAFYTTAPLTLNATTPQGTVSVQAFERGPGSDIAPNQIVGIDPTYLAVYYNNLAPATLSVTNPQQFSGGTARESDETYRNRLLGLPRNIWTLETVRRAVLDLNGVLDVALSDPLGGVDVSQSYFNLFN